MESAGFPPGPAAARKELPQETLQAWVFQDERVEDTLPVAAVGGEPGMPQVSQVARQEGLRELQDVLEVADAELSAPK